MSRYRDDTPGRVNYGGPLVLILIFAAVAIWLAMRPQQGEKEYSAFSSISPAKDGCLALYGLLDELGYKPQRYVDTEYRYPEKACMLALESGDEFSYLFSGGLDIKQLRLWLEQGGCLILASSGMYDSTASELLNELAPGSSDASSSAAELRVSAGRLRDGEQGKMAALSRVYRSGSIYKLNKGRPEIWKDVEFLETAEPEGSSNFAADSMLSTFDPARSTPVLEPVLLYKKVEKGELFILERPEILTNGWIARADNHRLILNLLSYAGKGRNLYFDEHMHGYQGHGENAFSVLFHTTGGRLLLTFSALLVLLWLGQAISPARFKPASIPQRRQLTEMVLAQADLFRRGNARHSVADALVDTLRRAYADSLHLPHAPAASEMADWLRRSSATMDARERRLLEPLQNYLDSRLLPRSGTEISAIAQGCDLMRARLERGRG